MDDGSTDNSQEIIQRYAETDPRIIAIYQENSGPSAAVNRAIQQAKGKFIALHTSDDISMPDRLEKQLEFLSAHENYDITGSYI